jgi:ribonucleoside-diphosphate reductase alpha chain
VQPKWMKNRSASSDVEIHRESEPVAMAACSLDDPTCEACQ